MIKNPAMGQRIKQARVSAGLTQTQLAARCDVRERTVLRWENDDNVPSGKYLRDLVAVLDVDPVWLVEGISDEQPEAVA